MSPPVDPTAPPGVARKPKVLIVDDVNANLVALDALLSDLDCDVCPASSGDEALRLLLKNDFAVILLDVQMPGMDGYEVAQHVRSHPRTAATPIIFLTAARDDEETTHRAYGTGAVDFLSKPFRPSILASKVRVFLDLHLKRSELSLANERLARANKELTEAHQQLRETQSQLVQSAKMASLGQLVAGIAHEVNNPLAFCLSHLRTVSGKLTKVDEEIRPSLSETGIEHWEKAQQRLDEMSLGLDRIADLVVKLRTFSRLDEGEYKSISIRESVAAVLTILGHRLTDEIEVSVSHVGPDLISCYPALLNQALMNLITNALDAVEPAGQIAIRTHEEGDHFVIVVVDTGIGIPPEIRDRILEPFFTTKPPGKGTGLGLSMCYSIVRQHDGTLHFDNEGKSTRVTIRIPMRRKAD